MSFFRCPDDEDVTCNVCERAFSTPRALEMHKQKKRHWWCVFNFSISPAIYRAGRREREPLFAPPGFDNVKGGPMCGVCVFSFLLSSPQMVSNLTDDVTTGKRKLKGHFPCTLGTSLASWHFLSLAMTNDVCITPYKTSMVSLSSCNVCDALFESSLELEYHKDQHEHWTDDEEDEEDDDDEEDDEGDIVADEDDVRRLRRLRRRLDRVGCGEEDEEETGFGGGHISADKALLLL